VGNRLGRGQKRVVEKNRKARPSSQDENQKSEGANPSDHLWGRNKSPKKLANTKKAQKMRELTNERWKRNRGES